MYASEEDYKRALLLQPDNVAALHHLGTIREKIGGDRLPMALQDFNMVLKIDPDYAPAFNGRGLVQDRLSKYEDAIYDFSKAIKIDP